MKNGSIEAENFRLEEIDEILEHLCVSWLPSPYFPCPSYYSSVGFAWGFPTQNSGAVLIVYLI